MLINSDKNFSLMTRRGKIELGPAYDFLNSTISMKKVIDELALPLMGEKRKSIDRLFWIIKEMKK